MYPAFLQQNAYRKPIQQVNHSPGEGNHPDLPIHEPASDIVNVHIYTTHHMTKTFTEPQYSTWRPASACKQNAKSNEKHQCLKSDSIPYKRGFTPTQQPSDLHQHSTLIGKVHLPYSNQPSHFLPRPASSMSSSDTLSPFDL